jgi:exonuclease VII large subunit
VKIKEILKAFRSRLDDQRIIRQQEEEITRLNNTIDNLLLKQGQYHEQHVESHEQRIETRELELRREYEAIIRGKNGEVEKIKNKYKSFWQIYEDLMERHVELEKLRVSILAKMNLVRGYDQESLKCLGTLVDEIEGFNRNINSLESRAGKLIPER